MKTKFIIICMTARCDLDANGVVLPVTVLVPNMDALLHGAPDKEVAVEYDGDIHYVRKEDLQDIAFTTRKGVDARVQFDFPRVDGDEYATKLSDFDKEVIRRIQGGQLDIVLDSNYAKAVHILPALVPDGRIEYQVSNGIDGRRTESLDFYTYKLAKKAFDTIVAEGWGEAFGQSKDSE